VSLSGFLPFSVGCSRELLNPPLGMLKQKYTVMHYSDLANERAFKFKVQQTGLPSPISEVL
jgi:hypothetical protein